MLKARRQPHQGRATLIKPVPKRAPAGRTAQHLCDGHLRLGVGGEPVRVAPVVVGDGGGVDVDAGGDVRVQRPRQWVRQCPGGDAADLQSRGQVRQHIGLGRGRRGGDAEGVGLVGDHPFGHQQLGQPAPQLPAFAGVRPRQSVGLRRGTQGGLAGVDLVDEHRGAVHGGGQTHRTLTATAGV